MSDRTPQEIVDYWFEQARISLDRPTNVTMTRRELGELLIAHEAIVNDWRTSALNLETEVRMLEGLR